jgi:hypothetical protein
MASRAETLAHRHAKRTADAEDAIDADATLDVGTSDKRRHMRDKLMGEILLEDALRRTNRASGVQVQASAEETRRMIAGLEASVRPSARQRFVDAAYVDAAGNLLPREKKRLERELEAAQRAEERRLFEKQRAVLTRGSSALATRQQSRAKHTRTPMPVRRSTRKPAPKKWVTPSGRVTTMAAHRKRSAAARSGGLIGRPRANMPRRGGAFARALTTPRASSLPSTRSARSPWIGSPSPTSSASRSSSP